MIIKSSTPCDYIVEKYNELQNFTIAAGMQQYMQSAA